MLHCTYVIMKDKKIKIIIRFLKKSWLIIKKTFFRFIENQGLLISNGLAFKTIIALAPALIITAGVFKIFPTFSILKDNFINLLKDYIVPSSFEIIVSWINSILDKSGTISIISIFIFIYLTLDLLITLDNQVERIWASKLKRSIIQRILKYWALLSATPFVLAGYFYYSGLIRSFLILTPLSNLTYFEEIIYTFISLILLGAFFFFIYFIIPNAKVHIGKAIIISSIVSIVWIALRLIFTYYTKILMGRWNILYGSFAVLIFFILWTSVNWIILIFGVEFLCVWQNKLYKGNIRFKKLFLFDVGFLLLILEEFHANFISAGNGITTRELAEKFKYDQNDIKELITLFENTGFIVGDNNQNRHFYLKKDISNIKLSEIESIVWKRLFGINHKTSPKLRKICNNLGNYYFQHKDESVIYLDEI